MTTGMTKDQTKDLIPRARAPPAQVPIMRRSRSLSELPGSVRVPILRRTDNERMRARLEAGVQGLEELRLLREQQQRQMEEVRSTALQKKPTTSQNGRFPQSQPQPNQRRMSAASLRLSSQSLARISEEGDDSGGPFTNGRLQDCTNFGNFKQEHRRHSSFSLEACRKRGPLGSTDADVFEHELSAGPEILRKTSSWSSLPSSYNCRSVSSESLNERDTEISSNQFINFQNNRRNQRSLSFSAIPSSSYSQHVYRKDSLGEGNNENIEPMLRRGSIQCEAVLTGANNKKNLGIFKDVDISNISTDSPSPLHAILHGFKVNQCKQVDKAANRLSNGIPRRAESFSGGTPRVQKTGASYSKLVHGSENDLSPRNNVQRGVTHRRALSETDSTLTLSKGASLPNNIHDLGEGTVNNFFQKHKQGSSTQYMNTRNEKHNSYINHDGKFPEARVYRKQFSDDKNERNDTDGSKQSLASSQAKPRNGGQSPMENDTERRISEGNVFVEEGTSASPVPRQEERKDRQNQDVSRDTDPKSCVKQDSQSQAIKKQEDENRQPRQSQNTTTVPKQELEFCPTSPVQIPIHEKKFSIASDEGYVTSPPSTPRGRHAHSIISDSSWISTDLDDTSSSCEPSPVHMPRDLGVKVTSLQLKRSDFPQDYSKAKHSRRSSDYGSMSESTGTDQRRAVDCDREEHYDKESHGRADGAKQELFKYDGDSRPFRQTAV